jgi:hypothetical protein
MPRGETRLTHDGLTARIITGSRAVRWLRVLSPPTGAFVLGATIRFYRSAAAYLAAATSDADRVARRRLFAVLLAHEWCHVHQYQRHGWTFLPRWGGQVAAGLWRELTATTHRHPWWNTPFAVLTRCAKFPQRLRAAYKAAPLEREADEFAQANAVAFETLVELLP